MGHTLFVASWAYEGPMNWSKADCKDPLGTNILKAHGGEGCWNPVRGPGCPDQINFVFCVP